MALNQSIVFFDGRCNLCNGFVQFILKNEKKQIFSFCSLQSKFAQDFFSENAFDTNGIDSVVVYSNNEFYIQSEAAFKIIKTLKLPFRAFYYFKIFPKFITNTVYKFIAKYRYKLFGTNTTCWVMTEKNKLRFIA